MEAVERNHPVAPEELMAYLDGELESERALAVHAHLTDCRACGTLAAELRGVSRQMAAWHVPGSQRELQAPNPLVVTRRYWRLPLSWLHASSPWQIAAAGLVVAIAAAVWMVGTGRSQPRVASAVAMSAREFRTVQEEPVILGDKLTYLPRLESMRPNQGTPGSRVTNAAEPQGQVTGRTQKIIRTVSMTIVAKEFEGVRDAFDRLLRDVGGFVGGMQASDAGSGRSLRATLRVPAARLEEVVRSLRTLGHVVDESQSGQDVTEQVRDLEARLTNNRNTEKRLTEVLNNRTGRVSDVLEVEREIARVREEIERMEAERLNLERQVEYSSVTVQISEQRQATIDLGPTPVRTQLRNAFIEGVKNAYETLVATVVWLLSVGPFVVLWAALLWWPIRITFRMVRARAEVRA